MPPADRTPVRWMLAFALVIGALTVGVYWNTLGNEFVTFDDRKYIYENELVIGDGGLGAIWGDLFDDKPKLHYYPLTFSTFWIEHALVGIAPPDADMEKAAGQPAHPLYHWTQMILHAINAALVLFVLRALGVRFPTSVFVSALFALHPVCVASVAWVAERKNQVSAIFFWTALLLYINHRRRREAAPAASRRKTPWLYLASVFSFALALCGKAASLVLAPVIVATDRYLDRRWSWQSLFRAAPFFALGLVMIRITAIREAFIAKSWHPVEIWIRPFIAVAALVHYVTKMFVPVKQAIIYPRWPVTLAAPRYWISLAVVGVAAWLIWRYRRWLGDLWLWGLALFLLTVAPVLGLKHFIWMQFAFVSDHYMYYGSPGVLLMAALLFEKWWRPNGPGKPAEGEALEPGPRRGRLAAAVAVVVVALVGCGWRTVQQNRTWKNNATLWTHTNSVNPNCFTGRMNLGNHYYRHGDYERAMVQYREWARVDPNFARAWRSCARTAKQLGRMEEAFGYYRNAVAVADSKNPRSYSIHIEYADSLLRENRFAEALEEYEIILTKRPPDAEKIQKRVDWLRRRLRSPEPSDLRTSPVDP